MTRENFDPHCTFEYAPQGDYIALKVKGFKGVKNTSKRGKIQGFSRKSRSRLLQKIAKLKKDNIPLFVTLTYHENYPTNFEGFKYDFHRFFISLRNRFPGVGVIWKLEYQRRGAPHFHLLLFGVDFSEACKFIPAEWNRITEPTSLLHLYWHEGLLKNKHCVQYVKSWKGVKSYAGKYMAKVGDDPVLTSGRFWGVRGIIPYSVMMDFRLDMDAALNFRRAHRKLSGYKPRRLGFWSFGYLQSLVNYASWLQRESEERFCPENFPPGWYLSYKPEIFQYEREDISNEI